MRRERILTSLVTLSLVVVTVGGGSWHPSRAGGPPNPIFVDQSATGANSGRIWEDAKTDLQAALALALDGVDIWVAEGTYTPSATGNRGVSFALVDGVGVYGGFPTGGGDGTFMARDWEAYPTILSGDIGIPGDSSDNSYHVVTAKQVGDSTILDGCTVKGGNADGAGGDGYGGGMYSDEASPSLTRVIFKGNTAASGGGMRNRLGSPTLTEVTFKGNLAHIGAGIRNFRSHPTLTQVTFTGNMAGYSGGGIDNFESSPTLSHVAFTGNAAAQLGGGIINYSSNPTLTQVAFSGNTAGGSGGAMYNQDSSPALTNVTFSGNSADMSGGAISNTSHSAGTLTSCILWGNVADEGGDQIDNQDSTPTVSYSDVEESGGSDDWDSGLGADGGGNVDADPLFVDADGADDVTGSADDDLRLGSGSPAIDAGDNEAVPADVTTDLAGHPRFVDTPEIPDTGNGMPPIVDMGAYEFANDPPVALDDSYTTNEDTPLTVAAPGVLENDSDPDGDPLTAVLDSSPFTGALTLDADGAFIYTPVRDASGVVSFTYHAHDGTTNSNIATVTITVTAVNDPPVAVGDAYTAPEDTPLTVDAPGVLANDSDSDDDVLTAVKDSDPITGTLILKADGFFVYAPAPSTTGVVTFTYHAEDGTASSNIATVVITVTAVNDPPVAVDDAYATPEDTPLTVDAPGVLANDKDPEGEPLTAVLDTEPASGTVILSADGAFAYTPQPDANGAVTFTYHAHDGTASSNVATVTITVSAVNDHPTISDIPDQITGPGTPVGPIAFTVGDVETPADALALSAQSSDTTLAPTQNIVFGGSGANRTATITPAPGRTGEVTITIIVNDGSDTASDTFALTVESFRAYLPLVIRPTAPPLSARPERSG